MTCKDGLLHFQTIPVRFLLLNLLLLTQNKVSFWWGTRRTHSARHKFSVFIKMGQITFLCCRFGQTYRLTLAAVPTLLVLSIPEEFSEYWEQDFWEITKICSSYGLASSERSAWDFTRSLLVTHSKINLTFYKLSPRCQDCFRSSFPGWCLLQWKFLSNNTFVWRL